MQDHLAGLALRTIDQLGVASDERACKSLGQRKVDGVVRGGVCSEVERATNERRNCVDGPRCRGQRQNGDVDGRLLCRLQPPPENVANLGIDQIGHMDRTTGQGVPGSFATVGAVVQGVSQHTGVGNNHRRPSAMAFKVSSIDKSTPVDPRASRARVVANHSSVVGVVASRTTKLSA
jgi:hypothetical protein